VAVKGLNPILQASKPKRASEPISCLEKTDQDTHQWLEQAVRIAADRRKLYDTLMWQMPTVAFTGISFLFNVSLRFVEEEDNVTGRSVASIIGVLISLATLNFFARLRYFEFYDSDFIVKHLTYDDKNPILFGTHLKEDRDPYMRKRLIACGFRFINFYMTSSFKIWNYSLLMLTAANISILYGIYFRAEDRLFEVFLMIFLILMGLLITQDLWVNHQVMKSSNYVWSLRFLTLVMIYDVGLIILNWESLRILIELYWETLKGSIVSYAETLWKP
jgi:hypothetical protein